MKCLLFALLAAICTGAALAQTQHQGETILIITLEPYGTGTWQDNGQAKPFVYHKVVAVDGPAANLGATTGCTEAGGACSGTFTINDMTAFERITLRFQADAAETKSYQFATGTEVQIRFSAQGAIWACDDTPPSPIFHCELKANVELLGDDYICCKPDARIYPNSFNFNVRYLFTQAAASPFVFLSVKMPDDGDLASTETTFSWQGSDLGFGVSDDFAANQGSVTIVDTGSASGELSSVSCCLTSGSGDRKSVV